MKIIPPKRSLKAFLQISRSITGSWQVRFEIEHVLSKFKISRGCKKLRTFAVISIKRGFIIDCKKAFSSFSPENNGVC